MKSESFQKLAEHLRHLPGKHKQKLIGIDGGSGSGKSTFARLLQAELKGLEVIHIDDFYKGLPHKKVDPSQYEVSPNFDWDRLYTEVLEPVERGLPVEYQVYNWNIDAIDARVRVPQDAVVILEGLEVTQRRFANVYDYKVWITCPVPVRLERGVARDGEHMREMWAGDWLPFDEHYARVQNPASRADLVVDGQSFNFSNNTFTVLQA